MPDSARAEEAVATGPLGTLSHDELGVIVDGLADPLQPVVAVALSSTCLGLRTPLRAALEVLKEQHKLAVVLCSKVGWSCAQLSAAVAVNWSRQGLTPDDMWILGMLMRTNALLRLEELVLYGNGFGSLGVLALCYKLHRSSAPSLRLLNLMQNNIADVGAEAFASALRRGAMPNLDTLFLNCNAIGNRSLVVLAAPLRKLPRLFRLGLSNNKFGDEGMASLFASLKQDDFSMLECLALSWNNITNTGLSTLATAIRARGLPALSPEWLQLVGFSPDPYNPASASSIQAVFNELELAKRIDLKAIHHGQATHFKLRGHTPLLKLIHAFCAREGVATSALGFTYKGNTIEGYQTPLDLGMVSGDEIAVTSLLADEDQ